MRDFFAYRKRGPSTWKVYVVECCDQHLWAGRVVEEGDRRYRAYGRIYRDSPELVDLGVYLSARTARHQIVRRYRSQWDYSKMLKEVAS